MVVYKLYMFNMYQKYIISISVLLKGWLKTHKKTGNDQNEKRRLCNVVFPLWHIKLSNVTMGNIRCYVLFNDMTYSIYLKVKVKISTRCFFFLSFRRFWRNSASYEYKNILSSSDAQLLSIGNNDYLLKYKSFKIKKYFGSKSLAFW